jgi:putative membrane protein
MARRNMWRLFLQIVAGIVGIWLAARYIPGVEFIGDWQVLFLAGAILGLINFFIKPILKVITLPLRIITFGLFGLVINMLMVWIVSLIFPELIFPEQIIQKIVPIFLTSLIIWGINFILIKWLPTK